MKRELRSILFYLSLLMALGGCQPAGSVSPTALPYPTETLPAIAPGTTVIIDICDADPDHPDCVGSHRTSEAPGDLGETFIDPLGRFALDYPTGWYTMTMTPDPSDGVRVMDTLSLQEATRWVSLQVFPNPQQASLSVWIAEHGMPWPGEVTHQEEGWIHGVPVLRQRLENDDPDMGGPYVYALLWYPLGEHIVLWTAWPGEQAETLDLLERMASSLRQP